MSIDSLSIFQCLLQLLFSVFAMFYYRDHLLGCVHRHYFDAIVDGIIFMAPFLSIFTVDMEECQWRLYVDSVSFSFPETIYQLLKSSGKGCRVSQVQEYSNVKPGITSFFSFFPTSVSFVSFSCLTSLGKVPSTLLNLSRE